MPRETADTVDVLLQGGVVVGVLTGRLRRADVAIVGDRIVSVGGYARPAGRVIDCRGQFLAPGFIDGHLHLESSLLSPWEFARTAAELGCGSREPFAILSFLALPVIPQLRITDQGLVDVTRFQHVPLSAS